MIRSWPQPPAPLTLVHITLHPTRTQGITRSLADQSRTIRLPAYVHEFVLRLQKARVLLTSQVTHVTHVHMHGPLAYAHSVCTYARPSAPDGRMCLTCPWAQKTWHRPSCWPSPLTPAVEATTPRRFLPMWRSWVATLTLTLTPTLTLTQTPSFSPDPAAPHHTAAVGTAGD